MIQIDDIMKRSRYINLSNQQQEYDRFHSKSKTLLEANQYRFADKKFLLQHWESLHEDQTECFKLVIDILDEAYANDNIRDFNYTKSYIINEIAPTVRDAKQTARYIKYKTTRMKNKITRKLKKDNESLKEDNITEADIREAYVQILDSLDKYNHCDRVLENVYTIQKRFNIMNMVEAVDIHDKYQLPVLVDSICECINTYDADFKTRFNTVLETCFYFLSRKDKNFNKSLVLEQVVNNYIAKDLPEYKLIDMKTLIDESVIFDNTDKESVDFIYKAIPFEESSELAKPFLDNDNTKEIGITLESISNDMTDKDVHKVLASIRKSSVINEDVETLIGKMSLLYTGNDFCKICALESQRVEEDSCKEYLNILNKYAGKYNKSECVLIMDFDPFNEAFSSISKTAKDIVNDFKVKKMKSVTDVRTCVSKMFTKSPDQIIEGTPNFLSWIRGGFIIGATAIHPVLGAATLLVDQFIAMKLKRRDVSKMITVFKNERKLVSEKIKKADGKDKENLKEYEKYLKNSIHKLEDYESDLLSEYEKYLKDTGKKYDKDEELKSIKDDDYDFGDDYDFDLEATSFEKLFENSEYFSKEYFTSNIRKYIDCMNEDTIDIITDIACAHPSIISTSELHAILQEELTNLSDKYSGSKKWIRMTCLSSNIRKVDPESDSYIVTSDDEPSNIFEVISGLEDLFTEYSISKSLNPTNESASAMVKTITNKLRKTMQKAVDKDKEVSRRIDSAVNTFISGIQRAARNDNREAIIRGSILPSASKIVKAALIDAGVGVLTNPAIGVIMAIGQLIFSKKSTKKERQLVLDEIDIELEMCKRYLRQAEDQNDLEAQKQILRIQRTLERQRQRIEYNMKLHWAQDVPKIKNEED